MEKKRVGCLEESIRTLLGQPEFKLQRALCFHHKGGLFAGAAQDADVKVVTARIGTELDKNIKEFRSSNIMDQFQRQIALVFSPLQDYAFGSGTIDFPMWFADEFPGMSIVKANR